MATSGSKTVSVMSWITLKFAWEQTSQSAENNTTSIKWSMTATTNSSGALYKKNRTWTVVIDGTTYTGTVNVSLDKSSTQTLASGTATIKHNTNGTKTFAYSFTQQFELTLNSGKYMSTYSGSGSDTLTTIPRKSTISVPAGTLNTQQTITVTQQSTTYTHSIKAKCGSSTFYIKADGTTSTTEVKHNDCSIPWTPSIELASQEPQKESVSITFTLTTYSGSTSIGTAVVTASYAIPTNVIAPLSFTLTDKNGYASTYGAYVQGRSSLMVNMTTYGSYGAWIKSYKVEVGGMSFTNGTKDGTSIVVDIGTIAVSGTIPIVATVVDSRGRTTTASSTITALEYKAPTISSLTVFRSNSSGAAQAGGSYFTIRFSSKVYSLNSNNTATYRVAYKKTGTSSATSKWITAYTGQYTVTNGTYTFAADDASYDITLYVGDKFKETPQSVTGTSLSHTISLMKKGGKIVGAALGKLAETEDVFDIAYQSRFVGGILHQVLPTNSNLNDLKTPGTYMLSGDNSYTNVPSGGYDAFLEIVGTKDYAIIQRISFIDTFPIQYERSLYDQNGWTSWVCVRGDFVVERGESDGWTYLKWNSGRAECRKTVAVSTAISTAWGTMYVGTTKMSRQSYPFVFTEKPKEVASLTTAANAVWLFPESGGNGVNGAYQSAIYNVCRPSAVSAAATYYITIDAVGKWK